MFGVMIIFRDSQVKVVNIFLGRQNILVLK